MKLYIINNARMPTEKAHGFQIAKMCESFAGLGVRVELIVPTRVNKIQDDVFEYYKIKNNFKIKYLDSFDFFKFEKIIGSRLSYYLQSLAFLRKVREYKIATDDIVISRNPEIVGVMVDKGIKTYYDAHRWPESKNTIFKKLLKGISGVICNSEGTAKAFRDNGFTNCLLAPNGVDLDEYRLSKSKEVLRKELEIFGDKKIIMYVGHLYAWKGVDLIIDLARRSREKDWHFVLVGGTETDIAKYKKLVQDEDLNNISLLGHKQKSVIPKYQMAADVLLLPNIASNEESIRYTSPIKLFEYMASGVPILASDLPSIKEILNDSNAVLFRAGDIDDMAKSLNDILNTNLDVKAISDKALKDVKNYSWENRTKKILNFINK